MAKTVLLKPRGQLRIKGALTIREFQPGKDHISSLTNLINRSFTRLQQQGIDHPAATQDNKKTLQRISGGTCLVAYIDGQLVAAITYFAPTRTTGSRWLQRKGVAGFAQFAVSPGFQNVGLGRLLLQQVEQQARQDQATDLALSTPTHAEQLVRYYQAKGYSIIETVQWPWADYQSYIMSKPLHLPGTRSSE